MREFAWPAVCALLIAASVAAWLAGVAGYLPPQHGIWRADHWRGQPWTLWTASLVHFLPTHGLANALALGALAILGAALPAPPRDALALLLAWPLGTLALLAWPTVGGYYGLSGLVHSAAAVLAVRALRAPSTRWLGHLLAAGLVLKLGLERGWALPVGFDADWGFNVVYAAHLTGALVGAAAALLLDMVPFRRSFPRGREFSHRANSNTGFPPSRE